MCFPVIYWYITAYKIRWIDGHICRFAYIMYNLYAELLISTSLHIGNMKGSSIRFGIYLKFKVKDERF